MRSDFRDERPIRTTHYRAGVIGCGLMGKQHAAALRATPGVELSALADIDDGRLKQVGQENGVPKLYHDYREMLSHEDLDLVTISTQAPLHCQPVIAAAESGVKGILCEKPIGVDLAEADLMVETCDRHQVKLAINHWLRMHHSIHRALALLNEGTIGELVGIRIMDKGNRPAGISLLELATHFFDAARIYAGDVAWTMAHLSKVDEGGTSTRSATVADIMPSRVAWPRDRDCGLILGDRCSVVFGFHPAGRRARGVEAVYQTFFQLPQNKWTSGLELIGLDGILALRSSGGGISLMLHRGGWEAGASFEPVVVGEAAQYIVEWARGVQAPGVMLAMLDDLIGAIEEDREPYSSGRDGRAALEMIASVFESHRRGATVSLPLANREHVLRQWVEEARA